MVQVKDASELKSLITEDLKDVKQDQVTVWKKHVSRLEKRLKKTDEEENKYQSKFKQLNEKHKNMEPEENEEEDSSDSAALSLDKIRESMDT